MLLSTCTLELYLYSPQCLYSTAISLLPSVPVKYGYRSTPLSTCTVQLHIFSPPYQNIIAITLLPSVPVDYKYSNQYIYSTAISLLPSVLNSTDIPLIPSVPV